MLDLCCFFIQKFYTHGILVHLLYFNVKLLIKNWIYSHKICIFQEDKIDILKVLSKTIILSEDIDLHNIAVQTNNYTGADLYGLLYSTLLIAEKKLSKGLWKKMYDIYVWYIYIYIYMLPLQIFPSHYNL